MDKAALSFQPALVDKHDAVSEVLSPGRNKHTQLNQTLIWQTYNNNYKLEKNKLKPPSLKCMFLF